MLKSFHSFVVQRETFIECRCHLLASFGNVSDVVLDFGVKLYTGSERGKLSVRLLLTFSDV